MSLTTWNGTLDTSHASTFPALDTRHFNNDPNLLNVNGNGVSPTLDSSLVDEMEVLAAGTFYKPDFWLHINQHVTGNKILPDIVIAGQTQGVVDEARGHDGFPFRRSLA